MTQLPIHHVLADIQQALNRHASVVLQAPPGAGKTTAVPIALLDQPWLGDRQIIMLEPRRIAARNAAARMAWLLNEEVGQTVGYQIRQDRCLSKQTRILVVTEGILTRKLQADPELQNTALVIFDEFHERSLHADLSLALCLQSQQILRQDLKILVMSATLNTSAVADLLGNAPLIESEGRSYPVTCHYLDRSLKPSGSQYEKRRQLMGTVLSTIKTVIEQQQGSCLVFLPGVREINDIYRQLSDYLKSTSPGHILLARLHGSLNKQQQDQAIAPAPAGQRKIVLATNIAETSLTIEGIDCVVDAGLERRLQYNPATAMNSLLTVSISADSAAQRCGRAGRLSAGHCYRLWTEQQQQALSKHSPPEILHSDLTSLVLELAHWGVQDVDELQWMDRPADSSVNQAVGILQQLGAIDQQRKITSHGRAILGLGTHPRLAHMMLSALSMGQAWHACLLAALLSEKDILDRQQKTIDIHDRLKILLLIHQGKYAAKTRAVDHGLAQRILQTAKEFLQRLKQQEKKLTDRESVQLHLSGVLLAYAYPDRIARQRRENDVRYIMSNGKGAIIPEFLQQHLYDYLVIAQLDAMEGRARQGEALIYLAADIGQTQLEDYLPELISFQNLLVWNEHGQRVEAKQTASIGKLQLYEKLSADVEQDQITRCLLEGIKKTGLQCLNWTEQALKLKWRLQFIDYHLKNNPALEPQRKALALADFSDEALLHDLADWLGPHLSRENSIKQCQKLNLHDLLMARLSWEQQQQLNRLAPEKIKVPSGSSIAIDYQDVEQPVLAVRLQEVFGLYETPTVMDGQISLVMHLLSPARRPMQVTRDLRSFWETTYHDVKKELRGKYKKHYWPDDPFTAQATSKTKKNMQVRG